MAIVLRIDQGLVWAGFGDAVGTGMREYKKCVIAVDCKAGYFTNR